ncbi:hypothetical protein [Serratia marcescens]|uniref:hypothetical protein n=2 Tax=Serratia TaxID=613 RepID=UPI0012B50821|nr:hypothetical protein [Serratia marcescens]
MQKKSNLIVFYENERWGMIDSAEITCILNDKKVRAKNIQFTIDIRSYVELAEKIIGNNPFQRNKVTKSGSIYNLLKEDILQGCIIPPIVLASTYKFNEGNDNELFSAALNNHSDLKILDGLQRTLSLINVYKNHRDHFENLPEKYLIRAEVYLSISDTGILYRMLTLNTGQTPMSLRHQLEILYSKYLEYKLMDIIIIKETDDDAIDSIDKFKFSDLIDGFNSYIERNELPIDRFDILQTVQIMNDISSDDEENYQFTKFVQSYHAVISKLSQSNYDWSYPSEDKLPDEYKINSNPFGRTPFKIFNRSQAITGFGAAVGDLIQSNSIEKLEDTINFSDDINFNEKDFLLLNKFLDDVKEKSKKIGNGQRIFFKFFFKFFFDKDGSTFHNVEKSLEKAKNRALAEV